MDTPRLPLSPPLLPAPAAGTALLFAILESLPFRVYAFDANWRCVLQNCVSIRDFGSFVGRPFSEAPLPRQFAQQWLAAARQALNGKTGCFSAELEISGERRTYRSIVAPLFADGQADGVVGVDIEITDLRRTEAALRESEALYRLLAEHSTDVISRLTPSGEILYQSPASRTVLGRDPSQVIGTSAFAFVHPDDLPRISALWQEMRDTGQPQSATLRVLRADGKYIWMEAAGRAVPNPHSAAIEFVVTSRDVTPRMEAFQKLRQREAELAHLDRLSTTGQMASELAHELNQPLYAITNFADASTELLSRSGELNRAELAKWIGQIGQQARRAGEILRRVTQFVRKGELRLESLDLNQAVRDVLTMLDFELRRHGVDVRLALAPEPLVVTADSLLIEQVFVNLIRNAEQAMDQVPASQRTLTIATFREAGFVGAAVSDSGPGLSGQPSNHLFDSYVTTKSQGTGLGLAICRTTIEAHHGRIWAQNGDGGGATFRFVLPAAPEPSGSAQPAPPA